MQFITFKIRKIKTVSQLRHNARHNNRTDIPDCANPDKAKTNHHALDAVSMHRDRIEQIKAERSEAGANAMRSTSVQAVELVLGMSRDTMLAMTQEERLAFHLKQVEWAKDHYKGRGTLIQSDFHEDETNPHTHLLFIPDTKKLDKKSGKVLPTLSAKDFYGNKPELAKARKSYHDFVIADSRFKHLDIGGVATNPDYKSSEEYIDSIDNYRKATKNALEELKDIQAKLDLYESLPIDQLYVWFESILIDKEDLGRTEYTSMMKTARHQMEDGDRIGLMKSAKKRLSIQKGQIR